MSSLYWIERGEQPPLVTVNLAGGYCSDNYNHTFGSIEILHIFDQKDLSLCKMQMIGWFVRRGKLGKSNFVFQLMYEKTSETNGEFKISLYEELEDSDNKYLKSINGGYRKDGSIYGLSDFELSEELADFPQELIATVQYILNSFSKEILIKKGKHEDALISIRVDRVYEDDYRKFLKDEINKKFLKDSITSEGEKTTKKKEKSETKPVKNGSKKKPTSKATKKTTKKKEDKIDLEWSE